MEHRREAERLTRRSFLRAAGVAVGTFSAPNLLSARPPSVSARVSVPRISGRSDTLRLGVLLQRSSVYPQMGSNLLAGMNLFFDQRQRSLDGPQIELVTAEIGVSSMRADQEVNKLFKQRVDLAVGMFNPCMAGTLRSRFAANQTPLVAVHVGENMLRPGKHDEWIFHNSLSTWQSAWAMGAWAANHMGTRAVVASSFYDSGYDSLYAFRRGFESAGGTISDSLVTHLPHDPNALQRAIATIKQVGPDFVYGAYCGKPALNFVQAYAEAGLPGQVPLVGSPFMVDEYLLPEHSTAALGIKSCLPWAAGLNTAENRSFSTTFRARMGQAPDAFALLGYETARLITEAAFATGGDTQGDKFATALAGVQFQSPRGSWRMDAASRTPSTPLYLREVQRHAGVVSNIVLSELPPPSELNGSLTELQSSPKTGWVNPYMCV